MSRNSVGGVGVDDEPAFKRCGGASPSSSSCVLFSCHVMADRAFALWVVEYVWAHRTMDLHGVIDLSDWPQLDRRPLTFEDSWRLRVASAQASSIVKSRDVEKFERVAKFVDAVHRLVPRLVTAIKHMKITFGLKTMVVMWMLRQDGGVVDTVFKITQFFPNKLPHYEDQCTRREMFLMRRNNLDFKVLAQSLALDKDKCEDYMKKQMEEEYGEHYAQKVEDRLLQYLHQLELVLPEDTFIDKILKKKSPVTDEEKLLVDIITSHPATIATTLRRLLHHDGDSCPGAGVSPSPERGAADEETVESALSGSSSNVQECKTKHDVSKDRPSLREGNDNSDVWRQKTEEGGGVIHRVEEEEEKSIRKRASSPQFCSKHQRWVKNMLQECPDECPQEARTNVSTSPPLFQSSSSTSSSQDLTPSGLIPCQPEQQHPPPQTTVTPVSGQEHPSSTGSPPQPSSGEGLLSSVARLSPVVYLIDIASIRWSCRNLKPQQDSSDPSVTSRNKRAASTSRPPAPRSLCCRTSRGKDSPLDRLQSAAPTNPPNTTRDLQTGPVSQEASTLPTAPRKRTRTLCATTDAQTLETIHPPSSNLGVSFSAKSKALSSACNPVRSSHRLSRQQNHSHRRFQSQTQPCTSAASSTFSSDHVAIRSDICQVHARLSLLTQAVLLQSSLLQPYVSLTRLNAEVCYRAAEGGSSIGHEEEPMSGGTNDEERSQEEDLDSSFDVNSLYSGHSSSSDSEDCDPDYKPSIKNKRLLLSMGQISPTVTHPAVDL